MKKNARSNGRFVVPVGPRVLIRPIAPEEKSRGGIAIPESAKPKSREGVILRVGAGPEMDRDPAIREGAHVGFSPFSGAEIEVGDEKLLVMDLREILVVYPR